MRIAYVCCDPGVPVFGTKGCSIHVRAIIKEMLKAGHAVDLYAVRWDGEMADGLDVLPGTLSLKKLRRPDARDRAVREQQLIQLNRELRIQLENGPKYDLVYERFSLWSSAAQRFARDHGIRSILEVNAPLIDEQNRYRQLTDQVSATLLARDAMEFATGIVAVSTAVAEYVHRTQVETPIQVIPNGVDTDFFATAFQTIRKRLQQRAAGICDDPVCVGFVGTLRPWHGMHELGTAFADFHARHPSSRLLIVGDGPAKTDLLDAAGTSREAIEITGKMPHPQVAEQIAQFDLAVAPYPNVENFYFSPIKLFEYMACGLPIVASDIGDIPEYASFTSLAASDESAEETITISAERATANNTHVTATRSTCRLVPAGNSIEIAHALAELANNWHRADELGKFAAEFASSHLTWRHVLQQSFDHVFGAGSPTRVSLAKQGA